MNHSSKRSKYGF